MTCAAAVLKSPGEEGGGKARFFFGIYSENLHEFTVGVCSDAASF